MKQPANIIEIMQKKKVRNTQGPTHPSWSVPFLPHTGAMPCWGANIRPIFCFPLTIPPLFFFQCYHSVMGAWMSLTGGSWLGCGDC